MQHLLHVGTDAIEGYACASGFKHEHKALVAATVLLIVDDLVERAPTRAALQLPRCDLKTTRSSAVSFNPRAVVDLPPSGPPPTL